ncbi:hypothetical protein Q1695_015737 [Nippostrongylus brasiliensis]|nr:hypothetical protein Q1695_015737 [Nippostrongylus brasiliensis]
MIKVLSIINDEAYAMVVGDLYVMSRAELPSVTALFRLFLNLAKKIAGRMAEEAALPLLHAQFNVDGKAIISFRQHRNRIRLSCSNQTRLKGSAVRAQRLVVETSY